MCFPLNKIVFFFSSFSPDILMLFHTHKHTHTRWHTITLASRHTRRLLSLLQAPATFIHAGPSGPTELVRLSRAAASS